MSATEVTVSEPDMVDRKKINQAGQVYIKKEWKGEEVEVVVRRVTE